MTTTKVGWQHLVEGHPWFGEKGEKIELMAYSEFAPAPWIGIKPYSQREIHGTIFDKEDPHGWVVTEEEEELQMKPGLAQLAQDFALPILRVSQGIPEHLMSGPHKENLINNPYFPPELAALSPGLRHERYVCVMSIALGVTQDDKVRK